MQGSKVFALPSYSRETQNPGASGGQETNNNPSHVLELFTESVENVKNIVVEKITKRPEYNPIKHYKMLSRKRGVFFFVNCVDFPDCSKVRKGAEIDESNMITLFRELGFDIFYYKNISLQTFHDLIVQLIKSPHLRTAESFVLCISSHGSFKDCHRLIDFSCGNRGIVSDIVDKFNNINCPDLCHRPKFFIFPESRRSDEGAVTERYDNRIHSEFHRVKQATPVGKYTDIKICYANTYGDGRNGTRYLSTFVDVLAHYAATSHLDDMLKIIGQKMSAYAERSPNESVPLFCNVSSEDIGFNKHLFFNPGYYESK